MNAETRDETLLDLADLDLREVNRILQSHNGSGSKACYRVRHPRGAHAVACGLDAPLGVTIEGHTGYYCAGMNKTASVTINGNTGVGVAENMMSGQVRVMGNTSQSAAASAHGGMLMVEGNASARCGISLKGADLVVKGNVGHMSMFMAQSGRLVVLGDAGDALGDSIYEARIYVRGRVKSLGADCVEKKLGAEHRAELEDLLTRAGCDGVGIDEFRRYGSARTLYNFHKDNLQAY